MLRDLGAWVRLNLDGAERSRTLDEAAAAGRDPVAEVLGELEP